MSDSSEQQTWQKNDFNQLQITVVAEDGLVSTWEFDLPEWVTDRIIADHQRVQTAVKALEQIADKRIMNWPDYREKWGDIGDSCDIAIGTLAQLRAPAGG